MKEHYMGNDFFHIALDKDGKLQPIAVAKLKIEELDILKKLLNTSKLKCTEIENDDGRHFLIIVDGNSQRPYPSAMIWKSIDSRIVDVKKEDLDVIQYVVKEFLKI